MRNLQEIQQKKFPSNKIVPQIVQPRPATAAAILKVSPRDPRLVRRTTPTSTYAQKLKETTSSNLQQNLNIDSRYSLGDFPSLSTNTPIINSVNNDSQSILRLEQILLKQAENQMKLTEDLRIMLTLLSTLISKLG